MYSDAQSAANWARRATQIMAVLYGRNHELTYAANVTMDMAHFRIEREDREREAAYDQEMLHAEGLARQILDSEEPPAAAGACARLAAAPIVVGAGRGRQQQLQCTACAQIFDLTPEQRIMRCPSCGTYCTHHGAFVEVKSSGVVDPEKDAFGSIMSEIFLDWSSADPDVHVTGDMLPLKLPSFSLRGFPRTRAKTSSLDFYDANMRSTINKIAMKHSHEWQSCSVCAMPRAAKQCSGCKVTRYCSMTCARSDHESGHKVRCKAIAEMVALAKLQAPGT